MKKKVLLYGPELNVVNAKYGGGTGGYTRNMITYLENFESNNFELIPSFHTVRNNGRFIVQNFASRFIIDSWRFLSNLRKHTPCAVHVLAQYRGATPREFMVSQFCHLFNIPLVYEVKAGEFDSWYQNTNAMNKFFIKSIIKNASEILCEGKRYIPFININFNRDSLYWPNFVPSSEIKPLRKLISKDFPKDTLKIVFVGFCYEGKGVFDLVKEANVFCQLERKVELNFVGHESSEFVGFLSTIQLDKNLSIIRHGKKKHEEVLEILNTADVFCLPTKHKGEGHNNSINEAMMLGIPIICTRHGFLEDVLSDGKCIFIEKEQQIKEALEIFISEPETVMKAINLSRIYFEQNLHSQVINPKLEKIYSELK